MLLNSSYVIPLLRNEKVQIQFLDTLFLFPSQANDYTHL